MNRFRSLSRVLATTLCLGLLVTVVACSDDSSGNGNSNTGNNGNGNSDGNGNGSGSSDGNGNSNGNGNSDGNGSSDGNGKCQLQPGEYTVTETKDPSSDPECPDGETYPETIGGDDSGDGSADPGGDEACTEELDEATCSTKLVCQEEEDGVVYDYTEEFTVGDDGQSYSGSYTIKSTEDGETITCKYTYESKKN